MIDTTATPQKVQRDKNEWKRELPKFILYDEKWRKGIANATPALFFCPTKDKAHFL